MKFMGWVLGAILLPLLCFANAFAQSGWCSGISVGQLSDLNGFVPFPSDNLWNTDITNAQVDANSANIIDYIGANVMLHPDFGSGKYARQSIGIPYQVVAGTQPKVTVRLGAYGDESDPGPMPLPRNALIEGYPVPGNGDRHVLVLDSGACWLYELYHAYRAGAGWRADSAAMWDMTIDAQRPYVDLHRCRRVADFRGPRALRRSRGRCHQSCAAIHGAAHAARVCGAGLALCVIE